MKNLVIQQIIVVTDGRSNVGGSPITAAKEAARKGITVNAIGILDQSRDSDAALEEVEHIARSGGGTWENTFLQRLGYTMHAMTQKTVNKTVEAIIGKQLKEIIGGGLEDIPPLSRRKMIDYMEQLGEEATIKCCIAMDCSGSMGNKMETARQSIIELIHSLESRPGKTEIAIIAYPGSQGDFYRVVCDFTHDILVVKNSLLHLKAGGMTPTAAAINKAIDLMLNIQEVTFQEVISNSEPLLHEGIV